MESMNIYGCVLSMWQLAELCDEHPCISHLITCPLPTSPQSLCNPSLCRDSQFPWLEKQEIVLKISSGVFPRTIFNAFWIIFLLWLFFVASGVTVEQAMVQYFSSFIFTLDDLLTCIFAACKKCSHAKVLLLSRHNICHFLPVQLITSTGGQHDCFCMEFPIATCCRRKKCLQRCELYTDQIGSTVSFCEII